MIEFKRTGDVMVFTCQAFTIEVIGDSEKITITDEAHSDEIEDVLNTAFDTLDRMLEHREKHTPVAKVDRDLKIDFDIKRTESLYPGGKITTGDASRMRDAVDRIYPHGALKTEGK